MPRPAPADSPLVRLSCVEDDALGEPLEVLWDTEVDARVVGGANWEAIASRGFDEPHLFSAYLNTLRWNCVTSTNPRLFQAPYRAGIEVKAFQLEPLRKALLMPRVNLFIAAPSGRCGPPLGGQRIQLVPLSPQMVGLQFAAAARAGRPRARLPPSVSVGAAPREIQHGPVAGPWRRRRRLPREPGSPMGAPRSSRPPPVGSDPP